MSAKQLITGGIGYFIKKFFVRKRTEAFFEILYQKLYILLDILQ